MTDAHSYPMIDQVILCASLFGVWLSGEAGRAALAGAAGGLIRHLMSELRPRRLRDGLVSIVVGAIMARYCGPIAMSVIKNNLGDVVLADEGIAAFAAGIMGMSLAKILLGIVDRQVRKVGGEDA